MKTEANKAIRTGSLFAAPRFDHATFLLKLFKRLGNIDSPLGSPPVVAASQAVSSKARTAPFADAADARTAR